MIIRGCNLDEVSTFIDKVEKERKKIHDDCSYKEDVLNNGESYNAIKKFFCEFTGFLQYNNKIKCETFYRARKSEKEQPYSSRMDLIYPPLGTHQKNRMNNTSFQVMYTSLNELTAISESELAEGDYFQLTRFYMDRELSVYNLGIFSQLYFNSPRDSDYVKKRTIELFGNPDHDRTIHGYSALENAMSDVLYSKEDDGHILSSILADAIFSSNPNIEAIMYPSLRNRYGINVAFKKGSADKLKISASFLNNVIKVYDNGFFKYHTKMECHNFSNPNNLEYTIVAENTTYR